MSEAEPMFNSIIPPEMARRYRVVPCELQSGVLTVAVTNTESWKALDMLRFRTGLEIIPLKKEPQEMEELLEHYCPREKIIVDGLSADLAKEKEEEGVLRSAEKTFGPVTHVLNEMANQAPVVRWVNRILEEGVRVYASDIHFEVCEKSFLVRIRRDGMLYEFERLPKEIAQAVISRVKIMSSMNIAETRMPQDGRIQVRLGGRHVDLRVSTLPTLYGESVVVRVLDRSATSLSLEELGFNASFIQNLRSLVKEPHGIILVTGPTGSGKTTTLYACLREIDQTKLKVITVEDPVEYEMAGLDQIQVQDGIGLNFSRVLRSVLRHDPDVIMIGEIRDEETAKIALQASLTGHLVISTLHTNDAPGAVTRLKEMGLQPFLIASTLRAVIAQRLLRRLCPHCRTEIPKASPALQTFSERELSGRTPVYEAKGCPACHGFGYSGRVAIGELFHVDPSIRNLITEGAELEELRAAARSRGMKTLAEEARVQLLRGVTSLDEYLRFQMVVRGGKGGLR